MLRKPKPFQMIVSCDCCCASAWTHHFCDIVPSLNASTEWIHWVLGKTEPIAIRQWAFIAYLSGHSIVRGHLINRVQNIINEIRKKQSDSRNRYCGTMLVIIIDVKNGFDKNECDEKANRFSSSFETGRSQIDDEKDKRPSSCTLPCNKIVLRCAVFVKSQFHSIFQHLWHLISLCYCNSSALCLMLG